VRRRYKIDSQSNHESYVGYNCNIGAEVGKELTACTKKKSPFRTSKTFLTKSVVFNVFRKIHYKNNVELQTADPIIIIVVFHGVLYVQENCYAQTLSIAYYRLPRKGLFSLSPHHILEGNLCFPYSTHSCAVDTDEPILAMQV
jgi:hypothetical protein